MDAVFYYSGIAIWSAGGAWLLLRLILHCVLKAWVDGETLAAVAKTLARKL